VPGKQSEHRQYRPSWEAIAYVHVLSPRSYDYTKGKLNELVDIIIDSGAKLFGESSCVHRRISVSLTPAPNNQRTVSAVGVPPRDVVDKLHKHGILYMVRMDRQYRSLGFLSSHQDMPTLDCQSILTDIP
jgi:hypothetical protein